MKLFGAFVVLLAVAVQVAVGYAPQYCNPPCHEDELCVKKDNNMRGTCVSTDIKKYLRKGQATCDFNRATVHFEFQFESSFEGKVEVSSALDQKVNRCRMSMNQRVLDGEDFRVYDLTVSLKDKNDPCLQFIVKDGRFPTYSMKFMMMQYSTGPSIYDKVDELKCTMIKNEY